MLKLEKTEVLGWGHAIRGMRNPLNSWGNGDSGYCRHDLLRDCTTCVHNSSNYPACSDRFEIGPNDLDLMTRLRNAGTDHRKFMRMITVYVDITAPLYWWKEFDTYKVGTVANSCSTMHKITDREFTREDFSCEHLISNRDMCWQEKMMTGPECNDSPMDILDIVVDALNVYRTKYLIAVKTESETGFSAKDIWWQMIQLLPSSYNQKRTIMLNYEVLANMYAARKSHKLDEWREFCAWIKTLPYSELITGPSLKNIPISNEIMEEAKRRVYKELNTQPKEDNVSRNDGLNKHYGGQED